MAVPEDPPGFVVQQEAKKAAWDNGYRLSKEPASGGWLRFGSTTARGDIWIAGDTSGHAWFLSLEHTGIAAELAALPPAPTAGPGIATYSFDSLTALHASLDRVYRLAVSLPDAPLDRFRSKTADLPQNTEAERLVVQRVGQDVFRNALLDYWDGRCPLTGIADLPLLRASHIVPWATCGSDAQRLDVHNGLLLSAHWDAAFDSGLVTFTDQGQAQASPNLSPEARAALHLDTAPRIERLTTQHRANLEWHRANWFRTD